MAAGGTHGEAVVGRGMREATTVRAASEDCPASSVSGAVWNPFKDL